MFHFNVLPLFHTVDDQYGEWGKQINGGGNSKRSFSKRRKEGFQKEDADGEKDKL